MITPSDSEIIGGQLVFPDAGQQMNTHLSAHCVFALFALMRFVLTAAPVAALQGRSCGGGWG